MRAITFFGTRALPLPAPEAAGVIRPTTGRTAEQRHRDER